MEKIEVDNSFAQPEFVCEPPSLVVPPLEDTNIKGVECPANTTPDEYYSSMTKILPEMLEKKMPPKIVNDWILISDDAHNDYYSLQDIGMVDGKEYVVKVESYYKKSLFGMRKKRRMYYREV